MTNTLINIITFGGHDWDLNKDVMDAQFEQLLAEDGASYRIRQWAIDLSDFETEIADPRSHRRGARGHHRRDRLLGPGQRRRRPGARQPRLHRGFLRSTGR